MVGLFKFLYRFKPRSENFQEPVLIPFTKKTDKKLTVPVPSISSMELA